MRSSLRDRRLASGYLWEQLLDAAKQLWPEFEPETTRKPLVGYPLPPQRVKQDTAPERPFMPRWRRWITQEDEDDTGI